MKVLFHHEPFDRDVSSGTLHAAYQWVELLSAFGVTEAAVITFVEEEEDQWPQVASDFIITTYTSAEAFVEANPDAVVIGTAKEADNHYRDFDYSGGDWLYIGGTFQTALPCACRVGIPTVGGRDLYPREAAAIILAEATR